MIDTALRAEQAALAAAKVADLVLIPCRPAIYDLSKRAADQPFSPAPLQMSAMCAPVVDPLRNARGRNLDHRPTLTTYRHRDRTKAPARFIRVGRASALPEIDP